jgi:hypothetical protein
MSGFWTMDDPMEFLRDFNMKKLFAMTYMNSLYDFDSLLQHLGLLNKESTCHKCGSVMTPYLPRRSVKSSSLLLSIIIKKCTGRCSAARRRTAEESGVSTPKLSSRQLPFQPRR